jgi:hypothetical protein
MKCVHVKKEPFDIYIGRPTKWGNPFTHKGEALAKYKVDTREEAIEMYKWWVVRQPELMKTLHELEGKTLGCWCKPKACHGEVLIKLIEHFKEKEQHEDESE